MADSAAHLDDDPVDMLALFEKHDVVDTLNFHEACEVGLAFDHEEAKVEGRAKRHRPMSAAEC